MKKIRKAWLHFAPLYFTVIFICYIVLFFFLSKIPMNYYFINHFYAVLYDYFHLLHSAIYFFSRTSLIFFFFPILTLLSTNLLFYMKVNNFVKGHCLEVWESIKSLHFGVRKKEFNLFVAFPTWRLWPRTISRISDLLEASLQLFFICSAVNRRSLIFYPIKSMNTHSLLVLYGAF